MPKTLVKKDDIKNDPKLAIIKAFRLANKRAGEAKQAGEEALPQYELACGKLKELAELAEANGFHIWVNTDGRTGHTYEKDYKPTDETLNDWEEHQRELASMESTMHDILSDALAHHVLTTPPNRNN